MFDMSGSIQYNGASMQQGLSGGGLKMRAEWYARQYVRSHVQGAPADGTRGLLTGEEDSPHPISNVKNY
jgi:hypothetical protein